MSAEKEIQKNVLNQLEKFGWSIIKLNNLKDIKNNFKKIVEERNIENLKKLNKTSLSETEFERLLSKIENNNSFSDYAEFFLDDDQSIETDNGDILYLNIFNKKKWCENVFQVSEEVSNNNIRHDILLFINGLPLANIELKNNNTIIRNAFHQTREYSKKLQSLMKFIQIFIISNENETRYYANNESINEKYVFKFSDFNNKPIDRIYTFIEHFLENCKFSKYISKYMINKRQDKTLIALRGYQVHGAEAALNHLSTSNKNGYLWHATGSGKTITSFKVAHIVAKDMGAFDKVIFLVDRKDLDSQTIREYNSFLESHNNIEEVKNSNILLEQLKSETQKDKLIITTIQKMNRLLESDKKDIKQKMSSLKDKKIVFIIDECHRSQFGDMNRNIKDHFNNIRYIGFTGTPIFEAKKKNSLITKDIFEENIHKYLMPNAIEDKNVLPFQLRCFNNNEKINELEIGKFLSSTNHLKNVIKNIVDNFEKRSIDRKFSSLVVLKDINTLINFYKLFKEEQENRQEINKNFKPLKVGATFSHSENYSEENIFRKEALKEIINDFNEHTKSNESVDNIQNYQNRLQSIIKEEFTIPKLNIVLVVDQLLTGFDAKKLNSIYLVKDIKAHSLIQAISRTNRVFEKDKELGNVFSYVPKLKENLDNAIKLYSNSNNINAFVSRNAEEIINETKDIYSKVNIDNMNELIENPTLENIEKVKAFMRNVNFLIENFRIIRTLDEYNDNLIDRTFNKQRLNELVKTSKKLKSAYEKIDEWDDYEEKEKSNLFDDVEIPLYLDEIAIINSEYIRSILDNAIAAKEKGDIKKTIAWLEDIKNRLETSEDNILLQNAFNDLIQAFEKDKEIDLKNFLREIFKKQKNDFINKFKIKPESLEKQFNFFKLKDRFSLEIIDEWKSNIISLEQNLGFLEARKIKEELNREIKDNLKFLISKQEIFGE